MDIILIDPPWGGSDYKGTGQLLSQFNEFRREIYQGKNITCPLKDIELKLSDKTIYNLLKYINNNITYKTIVVKLPLNDVLSPYSKKKKKIDFANV